MVFGEINHLWDTIGHIGQSPAEDTDLVIITVNLDSRSVEFVFESCAILVFCENLFSIIRHLGQHRFDWDEQSQTNALYRRGTSRHRKAGYISDITVQHVRSAN